MAAAMTDNINFLCDMLRTVLATRAAHIWVEVQSARQISHSQHRGLRVPSKWRETGGGLQFLVL